MRSLLPYSVTAVLLGLLVFASCDPTPDARPGSSTVVDSIANAYTEEGRWHGGMTVFVGGETVFSGASGLADRDAGTSNRPDQPFDAFSMTKSFTAVLALQLVDEGRLALDGVISDYLPDYGGPGRDQITVHHLLSHRSGLPEHTMLIPDYWSALPNVGIDSVFAVVESSALDFEPGTAFAYTNTGYVVLARILERVGGDSFGALIRSRITEPLGMSHTTWVARPGDFADVAAGYQDDDPVATETVQIGEGGLVSTPADFVRFLRALGSPALLRAETWDLAFSPHSLPDEATRFHPAHLTPYGYGFGLGEITSDRGRAAHTVFHGGAGVGGSAYFFRILGADAGYIAWNNVAEAQPFYPELDEVVAAALDRSTMAPSN